MRYCIPIRIARSLKIDDQVLLRIWSNGDFQVLLVGEEIGTTTVQKRILDTLSFIVENINPGRLNNSL